MGKSRRTRPSTPPPRASPGGVPRRARWLAPLGIAMCAAAVYANATGGPFLFDDRAAIEENASIRQLWRLGAIVNPPADTPVSGRPLVNLSFAANYAASGLRVRGYHLLNIGLHVLAALTLFGLLRRTFERSGQGAPGVPGQVSGSIAARAASVAPDSLMPALVCTLLWAVHPLNTEAVNYVTQRTELMVGLFYLLALYAAVRSVEDSRARWVVVASLSALCAAVSKESAITLPLVIVLWDRVFVFGSLREAWRRRRALYLATASACWIPFAVLASQLPVERSLTANSAPVWIYVLNQAQVIPHYLRLIVWPAGLILDYGPMPHAVWRDALPGLTMIAALIGLTVVALVRAPALGFWGAWVFITLAPSSSFVPIATEVAAERRMYLPLAGAIAFLATLAAVALRRAARRAWQARLAWGLALAAVAGLAGVTVARNADYSSGLRIWQTVVERRPHARAREHLSEYLRDAGRRDEAIAQLQLAAPESPAARHALAASLLERGDVDEAIAQFAVFVRDHPRDPDIGLARREYAAALRRSGNLSSAIEQLRLATTAAPRDLTSAVDLADALNQSGDADAAIAEYRRAEQLHPDNVVVLSNLGVLLASRGLTADAVPTLRRALDLDQGLVAPRLQLLQLQLVARQFPEAVEEGRTLVRIAPNSADAHNLLGVALANLGELDAARASFADALRINPTHADARQNLIRVDDRLRAARATNH